ncbi:PREDICTED: ribosome-recycling factor, mitochondrial [Vollenhovia emeryi]|uniref:ribosome-recycling factor, mitochondrial n=1 Tax=Vollenhovia emeryi TaxID=411798 RepID=UPI0005F4148D|nr:PREDICTED: ribosome-recycling factor, mitochondrial [Vollenhovia emeryi]
MGSLMGIRFCTNTQLRNCAVISAFKPIKKYIYHCSSNNGIQRLQSRQKSPQINQCCDSFHFLPCKCIRVDNARHFSTASVLAKNKNRGEKKQKPQHIDYNEFEQVVDTNKLISQFDKTIEDLKSDFTQHLSVRSSMGAIEMLPIKFEGKDYTLQEFAQISRKPKLVVLNVSTFPQAIPDILKSIARNQMNLNPQQDGTTIYIPIPKVTKEHRETLSKNAKNFYVKCCDHIRDVRNKQIKIVKQKEKLAKDLVFRVENYIDILSHQYTSKAEQMLETKQKELLGDSE